MNKTKLTECCNAYSTFFGDELICKKCYNNVPFGEGDGTIEIDKSGKEISAKPIIKDQYQID